MRSSDNNAVYSVIFLMLVVAAAATTGSITVVVSTLGVLTSYYSAATGLRQIIWRMDGGIRRRVRRRGTRRRVTLRDPVK